MRIGNNDLKDGVVLAPLAGYSDIGMRHLARMYGADLTYTEMISAKGLCYNNLKTKELMITSELEKPSAIQLFGASVDAYATVVDRGMVEEFDIIDINMGCPVRKIVSNGEGSAMMMDIPNAMEIVRALKASKKAVSVKIRSGYMEVNAPQFALAMQEAGAGAVTVHARTREQFYAGKADWEVIKAVVKSVSIPVIGNGDIKCYQDIERMKEYTGCSGVMIGRAALGNPYIFSNRTPENILNDIHLHIQMLLKVYSERVTINLMKKHICFYGKHIHSPKALRVSVNNAKHLEDIYSIIDLYFR